ATSSAYGYLALFRELLPWFGTGHSEGMCLKYRFPDDEVERDRCRLVERLPSRYSCDMPGRKPARAADVRGVIPPGAVRSSFSVCELERVEGDPLEAGSLAHSCVNEFSPAKDAFGYCLIDPQLELGSDELVSMC